MSRPGLFTWAIVVGWACAMPATPAAAQSARMDLSIVPGSAEAGAVAKVPIRISSPLGIGAAQFDIIYDPAVVRFNGVENGALLPTGLVESNVMQPGRARVALVSSEEVKGTGVLLLVEFEVLAGPVGPTAIGLEAVRGWEQANNLPVNVAAQAGEWQRTAPASRVAGKVGAVPDRPDSGGGIPTWLLGVVVVVILAAVVGFILRRKTPAR